MDAVDITSMFLLGLLGTGHCMGMCGPLVVAFPARKGRLAPQLAYHAGRSTTYVALGALLAAMGSLAAKADPQGTLAAVARIQIGVSMLSAALLLTLGLARLGLLREPAALTGTLASGLPFAKTVTQNATSGKTLPMLPLGLLMGLLPCGLTYAAFARSLAAPSAVDGALLLAAFAAGTLPGLLLLGTALSRFAKKHVRLLDLLSGLVMIGMGALLVSDALVSL